MMRLPKGPFRGVLLTIAIAVLAHTSGAQEPDRFQQVVQPYVDSPPKDNN
jgi:hypothetical protein